MTDPYTPTTEDIKVSRRGGWHPNSIPGRNADAEFDRWLADHTASALEDAANRLVHHIPAGEQLRDRAARLRNPETHDSEEAR